MTNKKIHFIGIGGISMSGIAYIMQSFNAIISGSNIVNNEVTNKLIKDGINVLIGHHPEMIENADIIVYTAAIKEDDPELVKAKELIRFLTSELKHLSLIIFFGILDINKSKSILSLMLIVPIFFLIILSFSTKTLPLIDVKTLSNVAVISLYSRKLIFGILKQLIIFSYSFLPKLLYKTTLKIGWFKKSAIDNGEYKT